ncbi:MAG TPA: LysR family transcriptional regulator [Candidatus Avipropionibacterium avicola]|uniref:LysR family transcriptional regulator n=1 Tax=Candidatus Avipropionibacterium avicola TaxID=2840701 RepID=A0A9D1H257_9ACTN|nr:LysR family transcriptional regulator [Candidatus Avipropionibacterium avicola]
MDRARLEAFILVAEEESFSAAADRAGTAQSTISSRIKELESSLGLDLFIRNSRQVRLSEAGEAALPAARTALSALDAVAQSVDEVAGIRRGRVRLGVVTGAEVPELGEALAHFADRFPQIELVITNASSADLEVAVAGGSLDLALVVRRGPSPLRWEGLLRDRLMLISDGTDARGRGGRTVTIADLHGRRLIVLDADAGSREAIETAARRVNTQLSVVAQVATPGMAVDLHERGMGDLVIPSSVAPGRGLPVVDEHGDPVSIDVGLVMHPVIRTPAAELLLHRLLDDLGRPGPSS